MAHSNQVREFRLTDRGVELLDVYSGPEGVLTGSMRLTGLAREKAEERARIQDVEHKQRALNARREALEARIAALRKEFSVEEDQTLRLISQDRARIEVLKRDRQAMSQSRKADALADRETGSEKRS
jgi:circadian clock protein KaiC